MGVSVFDKTAGNSGGGNGADPPERFPGGRRGGAEAARPHISVVARRPQRQTRADMRRARRVALPEAARHAASAMSAHRKAAVRGEAPHLAAEASGHYLACSTAEVKGDCSIC
jgi:hypothetical protein